MLPLLLLLFIIVPIAEIYVIIQVGQAIGALLDDRPADRRLDRSARCCMRSQGRAVWRRFNAPLAAGRAPAREVARRRARASSAARCC